MLKKKKVKTIKFSKIACLTLVLFCGNSFAQGDPLKPTLTWNGGGFSGLKGNFGTTDSYGFDSYFIYLGLRAQLSPHWSVNTKLDSDSLATQFPTNSFGIRSFFIENQEGLSDGARFRFGRHGTLYTESIESAVPLRWLGASLNRSLGPYSLIYRTINGVSLLMDYGILEGGFQLHNGEESVLALGDADSSVGLNLFLGLKPFANDSSSVAKNMKINFTYALDTKADGNALSTTGTSTTGMSSWLLGLTYNDKPVDASIEFGQYKIPDTSSATVYAAILNFKFANTGASLFLKYFGSNDAAQSLFSTVGVFSTPKSELSIGPAFLLSKVVSTALIYQRTVPTVGDPTQALFWKWNADF